MTNISSSPVVIGLDSGGTSTTAAAFTGTSVVAHVQGAGANPRSSRGDFLAQLTELLQHLVSELPEVDVQACVAGVSGAGPAGREAAEALVAAACVQADIHPEVLQVCPDPDIAFAAGSAEPDGTLLLAGTGSIACQYQNFQQKQRADGLGWILGDMGSGIWLGLQGLRAAAVALDGRGAETALSAEACQLAAEAGISTGDRRQDLVKLVDLCSPAQLGGFASRVVDSAHAGDPVAAEIIQQGVQALIETHQVVDPGTGPVVLAGSVLTTPGPVREQVLAHLGERARDAHQPILGAVRMAAVLAGWPVPGVEELVLPAVTTVPKRPSPSLVIDRYRPEDRDALYEICLRTGDSGDDATGKYQDGDLLGHLYLGAYLQLEPELAFVLRNEDGVPLGYCVAAADTASFQERCEAQWWPALRQHYAQPEESDDSTDARLIRKIYAPDRADEQLLNTHPAHLHIDLLPEAQGSGNGRRLLETTLDALAQAGASGVHLGVGGRNIRAIGFYENIGLRTLKHLPFGLMMGTRLPMR